MNKREEHNHRNPAYIYEEGRAGGGPDSTSASSVSSRSSTKMIRTKLKTHGNKRWLLLAGAVAVVVIIVATVLAVYFTQDGETELPLAQVDAEKNSGNVSSMTTTQSVTVPSSMVPTSTQASSTPRRPTRTTARVTTTSQPEPETTTPEVTIPTTTTRDLTVPSNLSVTITDILYQPDDVRTLTLSCVGRHGGQWNRLTIRRQFKDSYEALGTVVNQVTTPSTVVFHPNVTSIDDVKNYEVTLMLTFDPFECTDLTNFTCALEADDATVTSDYKLTIFLSGPEIILPHSIIEDRPVTLRCLAESWGADASVVWKFRPADTDGFMVFSVPAVTVVTQKNCSQVINSSLTFTPTMFEHGAHFRCELNVPWRHPQLSQPTSAEATFNVLSDDFCKGKRQSSIYPHPHGDCTVVIYCINSAPLVYEVECEPGQCYDSAKTACVS